MASMDVDAGVRVVEATGPAEEAGVRVGDIITRLNHQSVDSPSKFTEISGNLTAGRTVPVLVLRNSNPVFLALRVPE
jgi:S1-C subfamily serine protease